MKNFPSILRTGILLASAAFAFAEGTPSPTESPQEIRLVAQFDQNGDHQLDATERRNARAFLARQTAAFTPATSRPGIVPQVAALEPTKPGEKLNLATSLSFPDRSLYEPKVFRTVSLEFEDADWEKELSDFAPTDVLVPATLTLDGKIYPGVGVRFKNRNAEPETATGYKRALKVVLNYSNLGQTISGRRQLILLDAATDATMLRTVLYSHVARQYIQAPEANLLRVAINGENWGTYVSVEPFDDVFIKEKLSATAGSWWSVSPGGNLAYLGANPDAYRKSYHLKSAENPEAWNALIDLCKIIDQKPTNPDWEPSLAKRLDIDSTLKYFALENVLINQDGYGSKEGDYGLYLGEDGRFRLVPLDAEASFQLVEYSEMEKRPQRKSSEAREPKKDGTTAAGGPGKPPTGLTKKDFPKQTATDLAMLLSYSFVNKADSDYDNKLTKDEWMTFARAWFVVMDEDLVGKLTRDQFVEKFRTILTPASGIDGRTKQSFGKDDAAGMIGRDFFKAMDRNQDGFLVSDEINETFAQWFAEWSSSKPATITQPALQRAFNTLFSRTTFQADQSFIVNRNVSEIGGDDRGGGGRGKGGGGNGVGLGPLRFRGSGRGNRGETRTLVTYSAQLYPLAGLDENDKPLLAKLLLAPALRQRYLAYVHDIAENWLDWKKLGPVAKQYHDLISDEVQKETHKANSYPHFVQEFDQDPTEGPRDGDAAASLKIFAAERRKYLLKDENVANAGGDK